MGFFCCEDSGGDVLNLEAQLVHQVDDALLCEPAQMRAIKQALIGLGPMAVEQIGDHAPVLSIGDAGQELSVVFQQRQQFLQYSHGVDEMFQHIAKHQAIHLLNVPWKSC